MSVQPYEFTAPTVDEAIALGLQELGLQPEDVEVQVVRKGSRGLLGIGRTDAIVRLIPRHSPAPTSEEVAKPAEPEVSSAPSEQEAPEGPASDLSASQEELPAPGSAQAAPLSAEATPSPPPPLPSPQEIGQLARDLLTEMVDLMGIRARVELHFLDPDQGTDPVIRLNVVGDDLGMLIGRHGQTLASVQYLVRLMVNQRIHRWIPLIVDVNDYREERAERLQRLALRLAEQVVSSGRGVALEPMPAADRRQIHLALRDHPQVYTQSVGEGDRRKVQILPK